MRVLAIYLVAACVLGAHSQLPQSTVRAIDTVTKKLDNICKQSLGALIERVFGKGQTSAVCDLNGRVQGFLNPGSGCPNALGDRNNITITLGLALNCSATAGCANAQSGVVRDVTELLRCILTSQNNLLQILGQAVQNVLVGLQDIPVILKIVQLILFTLGTKLEDLACSGSLSLIGIAIVLPIVLSIILIGVTVGLIQSVLAPVGFLVLGLLPVLLLVVFLVSGLVLLLSTILNQGVQGLLTELIKGLAGALMGTAVMCPEAAAQLTGAEIRELINPPSIMQLLDAFNTLTPLAGGASGLAGGLGAMGGFGNFGNFGGNIGAMFG